MGELLKTYEIHINKCKEIISELKKVKEFVIESKKSEKVVKSVATGFGIVSTITTALLFTSLTGKLLDFVRIGLHSHTKNLGLDIYPYSIPKPKKIMNWVLAMGILLRAKFT